jgi:3-deoxy-D-manno-octulosonic-acid transferase
MLEPAYWSKVIAFGPYMQNFRDIAKLFLDAGAAIEVRNPEEFAHATWLLENKEARESDWARMRAEVLEQNSGATARTLDGLAEISGP